jgi:hypothetical protein
MRQPLFTHLPLLAGALIGFAAASAATDYETPPTLSAAEVLSADVLRGENFEVMDEVRNDGFMNLYQIESDYGRFEAYGSPNLPVIIQEIEALAQLDDLSKSEVFLDAMKRSAMGQVQVIKTFAAKPVQTIKGIPSGLGRTFRKVKRDVDEGYDAVKDAVTGEEEKEEEGEEGAADEGEKESGVDKAVDATEDYAKKYFGVTGAERRWHAQLGTNPYTQNETLRHAIKEVAKVDATASFGMRFVVPRIPGVSELKTINEIVWSLDPRELRDRNIKKLQGGGVDPEMIESFMSNPWFDPVMQTIVINSLGRMEGVSGREVAIEIASAAESRVEARFDLANIVLLGIFHKTVSPTTRLVRGGPVPGAVTADGRLLVIASLDHVFWTEPIATALQAMTRTWASEDVERREFWLRGRASDRFAQEAEKLGWSVRQRVELRLPESTETSDI